MNHPFQESLKNIEEQLESLKKMILKKKLQETDDMIIDNEEFQNLMNISAGTASNWREKGIIAYSQINSKIYYKIKDIRKLINDNYNPLKKK